MKLVYVIWEDASDLDEGSWIHRNNLPDPVASIFHQVGYLVSMNDQEVILTAAVSELHMAGRSRIPAGMVRKMVELSMRGPELTVPKPKRGKR